MNVGTWLWVAFSGFVLLLLALDLFVFHRTPHRVPLREAAAYSVLWVSLGLGFAGLLWLWQGSAPAGEYLAGYLVEKSLSLDNIFVFALVFSYFAVPVQLQYRVLFWGIVGAILLRAAFIAAGAALLAEFHLVVYLFGLLLVATGARIARHETVEIDPERNPLLRLLRRRRISSPMVPALVTVAAFDVVFAVDSIPAVFAITREPFLVFAANAFSLLGLRALYFLLAGSMQRFRYLNVGLGAILAFVGAKMLATDLFHVPIWASLGFIVLVLALTILVSLRVPTPQPPAATGSRARRRPGRPPTAARAGPR